MACIARQSDDEPGSFDPPRFQTEPPACYGPLELPGRDSHPLATTSLRWLSYSISTSNSGRTRGK